VRDLLKESYIPQLCQGIHNRVTIALVLYGKRY
jgi:hypothetical protein